MSNLLIPSYAQGFARNAAESENPGLWDGLVGLWMPSLGPTGGTLRDWSGRQNHGTLTNMDPATDWVTGRPGYGLDFDSVNDHVAVFDSMTVPPIFQGIGNNNNYTLHMIIQGLDSGTLGSSHWFPNTLLWELRQEKASGAHVVFSFGLTNNHLMLGRADNYLTSREREEGTVAVGGDVLHSVAAVVKNDVVSFYVDGVLDIARTYTTVTGDCSVATDASNMGFSMRWRDNGDTDPRFAFDGVIYQASIWSRALSPAKIQQLYVEPNAMLTLRRWVFKASAVAVGNPWYAFAQMAG